MPPAQNVDSKSTSHQYTSNSRAGITNNNINTNGGSQRNVSPYLQQQLPQQQQHPSHQQQPTQQMQQHPQQQQQQHSARRTPSQSTTGGTMIHAGGQSIMTSNNIQQGNVNISINKNNNNPGSLSGGGGNIRMNSSVNALPTPMFERLVTEEVQELKAYARIIENQNRRLAELERVHGDLEARLEQEARGRAQLEATLEGRERDWFLRYHELELDRNHWREEVTKEQSKNARLIDQVVRKDQDIHRMLQRKYDNQKESLSSSLRNPRQLNSNNKDSNNNDRHGTPPPQTPQDLHSGQSNTATNNSSFSNIRAIHQQLKSPHEIIAESGSMETVRIRNVKNLLTDFFGGA